MLDPDNKQFARPREDVVISVCISDLPNTKDAFQTVRELAARLDAAYRFREIILVVDETQREAFLELVEQVSDTRLFVVGPGSSHYDRRVIAAEEAIGDIVLVSTVKELAQLDALEFLGHAEETQTITLATRSESRPLMTGITTPIIAIGRIAGFKVNLNDYESIAMPRTLLNCILAHDEPQLALRFPPRDHRTPLICVPVKMDKIDRGGVSDLPRRLQLLQTLLVYLAPMVLSIVSFTSSILALLGLAYAFYIVGAWFLVEELAPGWLTTSAMLTVSAVFMGVSMLGLSLGLQHLLKQQAKDKAERMSEEVNRIDLFGKVALDLNVELESDAKALPRIEQ